MKCEDCLLIIEEYIDGELDEQDGQRYAGEADHFAQHDLQPRRGLGDDGVDDAVFDLARKASVSGLQVPSERLAREQGNAA